MSQRIITITDTPMTADWARVVEMLALPVIGFLLISAVALWAIKTNAQS